MKVGEWVWIVTLAQGQFLLLSWIAVEELHFSGDYTQYFSLISPKFGNLVEVAQE